MRNSMIKRDLTVVVGSGGIGLAIARRISSGRQILVANHTQELSNAAAETLENAGFTVTAMQADISSRAAVQEVVAKAQTLGPISLLVP